jgi:PhnB protein
MAVLNAYLNFNGECEEAFTFYAKVFGKEIAMVMRMKDVPPGSPMEGVDPNWIMHVSLPISGQSVLMGSDVPPAMGPARAGSNISISVQAESEAEADQIYAGLSSEGGVASFPMGDAFWGSYFGMCTDKYGINWMVSFDRNAPQG